MQYILYDVDKIKDYVFDSFRPKEVKGASDFIKALDFTPKTKNEDSKKEPLLRQLVEDFKEISDEHIIYSKGGSGLIKSTENNGKDICKWLEDHFKEYAIGGSLTAVFHDKEVPFPIAYDILNFKAQEQKSEKRLNKELESIDFNSPKKDDEKNNDNKYIEEKYRCGACGKRKAITTLQIGNDNIPYCDVCLAKRNHRTNTNNSITEAETLEDICKHNDYPDNKFILTIYGDLNEAGKHLSKIETEENLKSFSNGIFNTIETTLNKIDKKLKDEGFKYLAPVIGGDDILIFAHPKAFPLIFEELRKIEGLLKTNTKTENSMKMNFAFMLCKYNFPIYHIFQLAQSLLQKTKDVYYELPENSKSSRYGLFKVLEGGQNPSTDDVHQVENFLSLYEIAKRFALDKKIHTSALYNLLECLPDDEKEKEKKKEGEKENEKEKENENKDTGYSPAERIINTLYFLARHPEFETYIKHIEPIEWSEPGFYLSLNEKQIKLSPPILEHIIMLLDFIPDFYKPTNYTNSHEL